MTYSSGPRYFQHEAGTWSDRCRILARVEDVAGVFKASSHRRLAREERAADAALDPSASLPEVRLFLIEKSGVYLMRPTHKKCTLGAR